MVRRPCVIAILAILISFLVPTCVVTAAENESAKTQQTFRVVGYLPDYRVAQIDAAAARYLTDLVFFSVIPDPGGQFVSTVLDSPKTLALINRIRDEHHTKIHLCVGGWDRSQGFAEIAATPESRHRFAEGLTTYCLGHRFAGADIDWEHPQNLVESTNYGKLLAEIATEFQPHSLRLTAAMAAWQTLTSEAIKAVDAIHLMSYDANGKHSTLEQSKADVQRLLDAGVRAAKIRLGVPFYGRGITQRNLAKAYAEIAPTVKSADTDEIDGLYFNGPATIKAKIHYAKQQKLGGVMIWEIGQDASGDASLLKVIGEAIP